MRKTIGLVLTVLAFVMPFSVSCKNRSKTGLGISIGTGGGSS